MASVDDRIVAMKFDNAQFQQKVSDTIKSMDDLKKSLDFTNAKKGLDDLSLGSKNFNLEGISSAVEGIGSKFSAMGVIAFTVLSNITSKAIDAGVSIAKSLSLDQVLSGFHEYETNMNSIQTILSNTKSDGTSLEQVNSALDQLNTYSDQTIYNFSQMAKNIGTFTAAGIDLDSSVMGIKGIANLAAISGSNADQASTAMYQLSQALASGSVKLMDWNSVVNAGMGGEVFQKALFETGKTLGTIKDVPMAQTFDEWKDAGNTFRDSLQDGWITSEVLTNTLAGFTGDLTEAQVKAMGYTDEQTAQIMEMGKTGKAAATEVKTLTQLISTVKESIGSGWTTSFRTVFGDFEEAKTTFTEFNNAIGAVVSKNADARNALLQNWKDLGGRAVLIEGIKDAFAALAGILQPIKLAFHDIFPPATGKTLYDLTVKFRDFMEALKPSPATTVLLLRAFRGLFAIFSIGMEVVSGIGRFFRELFETFHKDSSGGLLSFVAGIGDALAKLKTALVDNRGIDIFFHKLAQSVIDLVAVVGPYLSRFVAKVQEVIDYFVGGFTGMFTNEGEGILLFANRVGMVLGDIKDWIVKAFGGGVPSIDGVGDAFGRVSERFGWLVGLAHILGSAWDWLMSKMDSIRAAFGKIGEKIGEAFSDIPQKIANAFTDTDYDTALDTVNVGLLGGFVLLVKKFVDSNPFESLNSLTDDIKKMFGGVTDTLSAMQTKLKSEALMNIAKALLVLVAAMVVLSLIDSGALTKSLIAMGIGFGQLVGIMTALNQISTGPRGSANLALLAIALAALGAALLLLALAMKVMATMSWEDIAKGLAVTTALLGGLALAIKPLSENSSGMIKVGAGLILIAVAMNILALAMKSMAEMNWDEMAQGFVGVGGGLLIIAKTMKMMPNGANLALQGLGLIEIAIALNIMALALKSFAEMSWGEMLHGFAALGGMLLILAGAMHLMPNGVSMALTGVGLLAIGAGLVLMAQALQSFGSMKWGDMIKGLVGMAAVLVILAVACIAMEESILGAAAILIVSGAMILLAFAVKQFARLSWGELLKGLIGLAASLAVLAIAAIAMTEAIPSLLALGAALILVGLGFTLIGAGAFLLATAFSIIFTAIVQNVSAVITTLKLLIKFIPELIVAIGDGLLQLAAKVVEALPGLISGLNQILQAFIQLIIDNVPLLIEAFVTFIMSALDAIQTVVPEIIATGFVILKALLQGISDNIEVIVTTVSDILTKFFDALSVKMPDIVKSGLGVLTAFLQGIADNIQQVVDAGVDILVKLLEGIAENIDDLLTAAADVIIKLVEGIGDNLYRIEVAAVDTITAFLDTLDDNILLLVDAGWDFIISLMNGVSDSIDEHIDEFRTAGINLVGSLIDGMTFGLASKIGGFLGKVGDFAGDVIDKIKHPWEIFSPSRVTMYLGGMLVEGLAVGIDKDTTVDKSIQSFSEGVISSFKETLGKLPDAIAGMDEFTPTITPVLDLTNVKNAAGQIGGLLGPSPSLAANASYSQAALLSASTRDQADTQIADTPATAPREIKFEQNNYSPEALSTADIYRQTRNQIAMMKEELAIL